MIQDTIRRTPTGLIALNVVMIVVVVALATLGTWQVYRRAWKLDLIERVEKRVHAAPVPAPGPSAWPGITAASDAYRHVRATGRYLQNQTTFVQALTELGGGFWVLTPLASTAGFTVLVNRGFVPSDRRDPANWRRHEGEITVTGLLRVSEPNGAFLRANDPAANRWYSRDVGAIARAHGLGMVAPYFIDADASREAAGRPTEETAERLNDLPVGGLTVVSFHNNHLIYAVTWYVLALMAAGALIYVDRDALRGRRTG